MLWLAHMLPALLIPALGVRLLSYVFPESRWAAAADLAATFLLGAVYLIFLLHTGLTRICVRCMNEVPEDAPIRAERLHPVLWFVHRTQTWRGNSVCVATLIVVSLGSGWLGIPRLPSNLAMTAYLFATVYGYWFHHRVRPWCRYCPRWDDGGGISKPSPDPVAHGTRT
ncbi:hypothetical protein [Nocardia thraciensis]